MTALLKSYSDNYHHQLMAKADDVEDIITYLFRTNISLQDSHSFTKPKT
jgi:hypothetical protein